MGVVVDTGVFILWERRRGSIEEMLIELDRPAFISVATASEMLVGVHRADSDIRREKRSIFVEAILTQFPILGIELPVARIHAELSAELKQMGTSIGYQALWIAATARKHGYAVMTTNLGEFSRVAGLEIIHVETT